MIQQANEKQTQIGICLLSALICLPIILFSEEISRDSALYYSAMIREFGQGNFSHAFFHMIPPVFVITGGLFALLGIEAFTAAKLAGSLYFVLSILLTYRFYRHFYSYKIAVVSALLLCLCSRILRYVGNGLLTSCKMFFLLAAVYGLIYFWKNRDKKSLALICLGCIGLTLVRGEGLPLSFLALAILTGMELRRAGKWYLPVKSCLVSAIFLLGILPWVYMEYKWTGYPVTDSRQLYKLRNIFPSVEVITQSVNPDHGQITQSENPSLYLANVLSLPESLRHNLKELFRGLYPQYLILFLIPFFIFFRKKADWQRRDTLLLSAFIIHSLYMYLAGMQVQKRYIVVGLPLLLPWISFAALAYFNWIKEKKGKEKMAWLLLGLFVILQLGQSYKEVVPSASEEERQQARYKEKLSQWLKAEGKEMVRPLKNKKTKYQKLYRNGRVPVVMTLDSRFTFYGKSDMIWPSKKLNRLEKISEACEQYQIHFIIVDPELADICPDLTNPDKLGEDFIHMPVNGAAKGSKSDQIFILGYVPHLKSASILKQN